VSIGNNLSNTFAKLKKALINIYGCSRCDENSTYLYGNYRHPSSPNKCVGLRYRLTQPTKNSEGIA